MPAKGQRRIKTATVAQNRQLYRYSARRETRGKVRWRIRRLFVITLPKRLCGRVTAQHFREVRGTVPLFLVLGPDAFGDILRLTSRRLRLGFDRGALTLHPFAVPRLHRLRLFLAAEDLADVGTKGSELTDTVLVIQQLMPAHTPDAASSDVRDRFGR